MTKLDEVAERSGRYVLFDGHLSAEALPVVRVMSDPNIWAEEAYPHLFSHKVRVMVEIAEPIGEQLDARIAAVEAELAALYRSRGGRRCGEGSTHYWCRCGKNAVNPNEGEDTCAACLARV